MENSLTTQSAAIDMMVPETFAHVQRAAKLYSASTIVPKDFQGDQGIANCVVAIEMAHRMGLPAMQVMQNLYIVHGRPTWKAEFVISRLHGKYADIDFEKDTQEGGRCRVVATRHDGRHVEGTWVSMKMAQAEGWLSKSGSKWKTMPEQMMMYRAATFFARVHAPELLNGVADQYEVSDAGYERESAAVQAINDSLRFTKQEPAPEPEPEPVQAEIIDDEILDDEIL